MTDQKGKLVLYSGSSGVGKGTILKKLMELDENVCLSVSDTTREPREGEIDGIHYHFLTDTAFDRLVEEDAFVEYATVHGNRYGTLRSEVDRVLARGNSVILEIDVQGGQSVKRIYPDVVCIFVEPPSWDTLVERLRGRGSETEESLAIRLNTAKGELELADTYDVRIVNDDLDEAVKEFVAIIERYEREDYFF